MSAGFVELSSDHRHFRVDQIDLLRPTVYQRAAAIIFSYQDRTTGNVSIVIIKLDRRNDAVQLARAIAWRRINAFPEGQYVVGTAADLNSSPFRLESCVDHYFRQQWLAQAQAKLSSDKKALNEPLESAKRQIDELSKQLTELECRRNQVVNSLSETESKLQIAECVLASERDHMQVLTSRLWIAGVFIIIIIIFIILMVAVPH